MKQISLGISALCLFAMTTVACDATEPRSRFPMAGTYELTTVLDTLRLEIGYGPTTCGSDRYCTRSNADTTGRLSGTFTLGEVADSSIGSYPVLNAVIVGHFCDSIDHVNHVCTHASDVAPTTYPTGVIIGPVVTSQVPGNVQGNIRGPASQTISLGGTFQGDSIAGSLSWWLTTTRNPTTYTGRFVARRRR